MEPELTFEVGPATLAPLHQEKGLDVYEKLGGVQALARLLKTSLEDGIKTSEVAARAVTFGENRIPSRPPKSFCAYLWDSTKDSMIRLLCVCALTEAVSATVEGSQHGMTTHTTQAIFEGASIIATVFLVCGIQSVQDFLKDRSFRKLNADVNHVMVNVTRDGKATEVLRYDLVVGDLVTISVGDILEADGVLVSGEDVECDESALTGEPEDMKKDTQFAPFLFAGTAVKNGSGSFLVTSVGTNTMSGRITALIRGHKLEGLSGPETAVAAGAQETEAEAVEPPAEGKEGEAKKDAQKEDKENKENKEEEEEEEEGGLRNSVLQAKLDIMMERIATIAFVASVIASTVRVIMFCSINYGVQGKAWSSDDVTKIIKAIFTGIALVVVAVPEGLPLAVTLALSLSIKKMQQDNNLVKHLDATETMGSATTICSDKTGTLTQNRMTVMRAYIGGLDIVGEHSKERSCGNVAKGTAALTADVAEKLALSICINKAEGTDISWDTAADRWEQRGNKTDCALLAFALDLGLDYREVRKDPIYSFTDSHTGGKIFGLKSYPFSSNRKRSGQAVPLTAAGAAGPCRIYVKGASEMILKLASHELKADGTVVPLTAEGRNQIFENAIDKFASRSMRTIALAYRDFPTQPSWDEELDPEEAVKLTGQTAKTFKAETGLVLLGVCGIHDPIRDGVPHAIQQCNRAGIDVRMVTGDHKATAIAIARECGILRKGVDYTKEGTGIQLTHKYTVLTGEEFRARVMDSKGRLDQASFDEVWPYLRVLARSSPEDKHTLVTGLCESALCETQLGKTLPIHQDKQVVAVTGDGTNDAPALRRAHVGFAMKITGTRVAQDAADILLLDDNFASVVKACLWGRNVYDSILKFLQFQLTVNISAVVVTLVGVFSYNTQPLSVVQMIWVNLIMDSLGALTFASEQPTEALLMRPPYGRNRELLSLYMKCNMVGQAAYQLLALFVILFAAAGRPCALTDQPCEAFPKGGFLHLESGMGRDVASPHLTLLFNAFVFMQLFNWINCRKLKHELNVFDGLHRSRTFILVWLIVLGIQIIIVAAAGTADGNQTVIGMIFQTSPLGGPEWAISVLVGAFSIPWQWAVILVSQAAIPGLKLLEVESSAWSRGARTFSATALSSSSLTSGTSIGRKASLTSDGKASVAAEAVPSAPVASPTVAVALDDKEPSVMVNC